MLLSLITVLPAQAENIAFAIDPQDLSAALKLFAVQSHREIFFTPELTRGKKSKGVKGTFDDIKALKVILEGTGLSFSVTASNAILVNDPRIKRDSSQAGASTASGSAPQNTGNPTPQSSTANSQSPASSSIPQGSANVPRDSASVDEYAAGIPEILVKGSRIMNVDVTRTEDDVQPYTIFDSEAIEQSGAVNIEDFLKQQLTMNTTAQTNAQGPPTLYGNVSSINLRGLGGNETLILIDGRRSAGVSLPGGVENQSDINGIPLSAIERIEVLPSSASAIYGGAAIGGVVNIILKKNFNGGDFKYTYDKASNSGADTRTVNGTYGISFGEGKTQVMLGGQYSDGSPLLMQDRLNLFGRGVSTILQNSPSYLYGPFNPFQGATPNIGSADGTYNADYTVFTPTPLTLRNGTPLNSTVTSIPAGAAPGSNISAGLLANAGRYNLNLSPGTGTNELQSPLGAVPLTKSAFATIRQSLFDDVQLFTEFSTTSNASRATVNPFSGSFLVPSTAPTDPFQQDVYVSFPSTVGSVDTSDSVTQSATIGVIAPLAHDWSSEFDYTWSRNSFEVAEPDLDQTAFLSALSSGVVNPFVDTIAHPLSLPYLGSGSFSGNSSLNDLNLRGSGPVASLPAGRATLTIGLEHRKEDTGDGTFSNVFPLTPASNNTIRYFGQSQSTDSLYAEALIPLVGPQNAVTALRSLELQLAGRSERYTVDVGTPYAVFGSDGSFEAGPPQGVHQTIHYTSTNPTIGLKYQPVGDVTVRASYATAFLPPTASQFASDPTPVCGPSPCNLITDPKNGQSYLVNSTGGGNPNLLPQTSKDWDLGLIWKPQEALLQGLRIDLEYYRIVQPNYITQATVQEIVSDPSYAGRVTRDPTTGLITTVDDSYVNAIEYKTSGWDLKVDYRKSTAFGTLGLHAAATFIRYDQRQYSIGSPYLEYASFPNDGGEAKIKANATLSWEYRGWTAAWTSTYYSGYWQSNSPGSPSYFQFGPSTYYTAAQGSNTIPSQIYHDIFASYTFNKGSHGGSFSDSLLSNVTVQFGIKNVFNTLPPFDAFSYPYFYSYYGDPRLRDFRIAVKKGF